MKRNKLTVEKLIKKLEKFPGNIEIYFAYHEHLNAWNGDIKTTKLGDEKILMFDVES